MAHNLPNAGNAKTHTWPDGVTTGLSVLAWPPAYFANYEALIRELGLKTEEVDLGFYIRDAKGCVGRRHGSRASRR